MPDESDSRRSRSEGGRAAPLWLTLDIVHDAGDWPDVAGAERLIAEAGAALAAAPRFAGEAGAEACVALSDDAAVQALNRRYRGMDKPTNVLSFPATPAPRAFSPPPCGGGAGVGGSPTADVLDSPPPNLPHKGGGISGVQHAKSIRMTGHRFNAGAPRALGDIVLAQETLAREARDQGIPLAHHLQHLVVHGLLHLLGFDHETEAEAREMEAAEVEILAGLGIPDPYRDQATPVTPWP